VRKIELAAQSGWLRISTLVGIRKLTIKEAQIFYALILKREQLYLINCNIYMMELMDHTYIYACMVGS
jgi:hypothetical protein